MNDWITQNGFLPEDATMAGVPLDRYPTLSEQQRIQIQAEMRKREATLIGQRGYGYTMQSDYVVARFFWKLTKLVVWLAIVLAVPVGLLWIAAPTLDFVAPDRPLKVAYDDSAQTLAGIEGTGAYARLTTPLLLNRLRTSSGDIRVTPANAPMVAAAWVSYQADPHSVDNVSAHNQNVLGYWFMALMQYQVSRGPNAAARNRGQSALFDVC